MELVFGRLALRNMRTILLIICVVMLGILASFAPIYQNYYTTNANPTLPSAVRGGWYSNAYSMNFVVGTIYTNLPYGAMVSFYSTGLLTSNTIATSVFGSIDSDGNGIPETTVAYSEISMVKLASETNRYSLNLTFPVNPNTAFRINSGVGSVTAVSGYGWISYFTTNSP